MVEKSIVDFGKTIKNKRRKKNITQEELSELTGISKKHIANIEKGISNPSFELATILAKQLEISIDNIIYADSLEKDQKIINELRIKLSNYSEESRCLCLNLIDVIIQELEKRA